MNETPCITASAYASNVVDHGALLGLFNHQAKAADLIGNRTAQAVLNVPIPQGIQPMTTARIVKVFIADANENLALEKRVLYTGAEQLTDLTDQELFYEVPITDILAKHNEVRKATVDKKQAEKFGRDIFLEPARIRDLKMVVVTVAQF